MRLHAFIDSFLEQSIPLIYLLHRSSYDIQSRIPDSKPPSLQIISGAERIRQQYLSLVRSAGDEILLIIPSINALHRERSIGVIEELQNAVKRGVKIRLLAAEDDFIKGMLDNLRANGLVVRRIETPTETKFKMLIVDKRQVFIVETKDDSKAQFKDAVGNAIFSSSPATVLPYVTIFESFWRETDLYERAREADRLKDEFVHVAAHELRNPIMPILSGTELMQDLLSNIEESVPKEVLAEIQDVTSMLNRNAVKLYRLSEDILQVSRIESGNMVLNFVPTSVNDILESAIDDVKKRYQSERPNVRIILDRRYGNGDITLYCDGGKISQTLMNLLDNAMKFTVEGQIIVTALVSESELVVSVQDSGTGVDPEIKQRLFEKFASKSVNGTGLGLYLCKSIVEAHGGRIWYDDTPRKKGAIFTFTIPVDDHSVVATESDAVAGSNAL